MWRARSGRIRKGQERGVGRQRGRSGSRKEVQGSSGWWGGDGHRTRGVLLRRAAPCSLAAAACAVSNARGSGSCVERRPLAIAVITCAKATDSGRGGGGLGDWGKLLLLLLLRVSKREEKQVREGGVRGRGELLRLLFLLVPLRHKNDAPCRRKSPPSVTETFFGTANRLCVGEEGEAGKWGHRELHKRQSNVRGPRSQTTRLPLPPPRHLPSGAQPEGPGA